MNRYPLLFPLTLGWSSASRLEAALQESLLFVAILWKIGKKIIFNTLSRSADLSLKRGISGYIVLTNFIDSSQFYDTYKHLPKISALLKYKSKSFNSSATAKA